MSNVFTGLKIEDVYGQLATPLKYLVLININELSSFVYILDLKDIKAITNGNNQPIDADSVDIKVLFSTDKDFMKDNSYYYFKRNTLYQILRDNYPKISNENNNAVVNACKNSCEEILNRMNLYKIKPPLQSKSFDFQRITASNIYNSNDNYLFMYIKDDTVYEINKDLMNKILYCFQTIRDRELHI